MKITSKITSAAAASAALLLVLSGCTSNDENVAESPSPVPSASEYVPVPSDRGAEIAATFADCAAIGELFGESVSSEEVQIDSVSPSGIFCDWGPAGAAAIYGVQIDVEAQEVPGVEGLSQEGLTVIEDPQVSALGGVVYSVQAEGEPQYVRIILPDASGVFSYSAGEQNDFVAPLKQLLIVE